MEWMIRLLCDKKSELEQEQRSLTKDVALLVSRQDAKMLQINELEFTLRLLRMSKE